MNWKDIYLNEEGTEFLYNGTKVFNKKFLKALKFHDPGLAPVHDITGWYHINTEGNPVYEMRYDRVFGYYFDRASVVVNGNAFHIDANGKQLYKENYAWTGNFQQNICVVRDHDNCYFHVDLNGKLIYKEKYLYAGDYYDNNSCVKDKTGWKHIRTDGTELNGKYFIDLGIFHKDFATARDENGWFHIDKTGNEIYSHRFLAIEPFYNGFAMVTEFNNQKIIIDEQGKIIINV